ncbi:MAG: LysE family transporter [Deltaproteobacteria bacterium]|nr:LysE family transporter [Deltaproteobacteria bacterium]
MFTAFILGYIFGFFGSVPIAGPISILVFSRGLEGQFRNGVYLAVGAAIAEACYAYLAFWGFSEFLVRYAWIDPLSKASAAVILLFLGVKLFARPSNRSEVSRPVSSNGRKRSFFLGFTLTALNPTLIATWTAAVAILYSTEILSFSPARALPFSVGTCIGIAGWFCLLLFILARYKSRFNPSTLDKVVRAMGVGLAILGLVFASTFARYLMR